MLRKPLALTLLALLSLSALAADRTLSKRDLVPNAGTISGIVHSVEGSSIRLADGLIVIDASEARIVVGRGREATIADIEPGMQLFAALRGDGKAATISATRIGDAALAGAVDSVDVAAQSLTLLGQTIHVDGDTSFGGFGHREGFDLSDILPNQIVQVQVDAVNGRLIAREVLVLSPVPPQVGRFRGTVKSIGTESWDIESGSETVTVAVNAQTKILGSPKAGDTVEVLYNVNSAGQKVAISIIKFELPPVPKVVQFHGKVKSIAGPTWVVTEDPARDRTFTVNERTKLVGNPGVGHFVHVFAHENSEDGTLTAISVMRLRF